MIRHLLASANTMPTSPACQPDVAERAAVGAAATLKTSTPFVWWHGESVDALVESMVWGEINEVEPPYTIQIYSTKNLPADVLQQIVWVNDFLLESKIDYKARKGRDSEVDFQVFD